MKIDKYINIPASDRSPRPTPYLQHMELLISLLTGILLICFSHVSRGVSTSSSIQLPYLFVFLLIGKSIFVFNYLCRRKRKQTALQKMANIKFKDVWIPAYLKSVLYFGFTLIFSFLTSMLVFLFLAMFIILMQILSMIYIKRSIINHGNTRRGHHSLSSSFRIRDLIIEILLFVGWGLIVEDFGNFDQNIQTIIAVLVTGSICFGSYYYLHARMFQLYQSEIDEMLTKQYPIEIISFIAHFIFFYSYYKTSSNPSSMGIFFFIEFPIHTFIAIIVSPLYEYLCLQMLRKVPFKYLFLTQLTGLFWFNLYCISNQKITTKLYISTFISLIAFFILIQAFSVEGMVKKINNITQYISSYFSRRKMKRNQMVEQDDSRLPASYHHQQFHSIPHKSAKQNKMEKMVEEQSQI